IKKLIGSSFVRKIRIRSRIGNHVWRLCTAENGLNVNQHAVFAYACSSVANPANREAFPLRADFLSPVFLKLDIDLGVNADLSQCVTEAFKAKITIGRGVNCDHQTATPSDHFVDA